jgi:hypothetical protein
VLLVDDDILVSMGAADMLLDLGHSVTEAQSGAQALKILESDWRFDVVVTDYAMPGMNRFELAQRIKADLHGFRSSWRRDTPNCPRTDRLNSAICPSLTVRRTWRRRWKRLSVPNAKREGCRVRIRQPERH